MDPIDEIPTLESVDDTLSWVGKSGAFRKLSIYRGHSRGIWQLRPSLLRKEKIASRYGGFDKLEREIFEIFKARSHPYLNSSKPDSELEWMALAQHHGCWTRLLDWTANPLVALFFATQKDEEDDKYEAVMWCCQDFDWYDESRLKALDSRPRLYLSLDTRAHAYSPKHITPRIVAQSGCFTVHSGHLGIWDLPSNEQEEPNGRDLGVMNMDEEIALFTEEHRDSMLARLPPKPGPPTAYDALPIAKKIEQIPKFGSLSKAVIPGESKKHIRRQLEKLNVTRASLFPGLDGISDYIKQFLEQSIE